MTEKEKASAGGTASVRALGRVVDGLEGAVSVSRARQLRMVVGMWDRALGMWPENVQRPRSVASLFSGEALWVFWELAVAGRLRMLAQDAVRPLTVASQRVVRDCLGILVEEVVPGRLVELPVVEQQEPKSVAPRGQFRVLYRELAEMAVGAPGVRDASALSYEDRVRLLAIVSVVLDTGCRSAELEAMRLADLGEGEGSLVVRRQPQNGVGPTVAEVCRLQDGTRVAVRRWLRVRAGLVRPMEGSDPGALWVSLRANQWQPEPGFPLRAQGIRQAYARGMCALNVLMAGRVGWEPMPTTLERLRRAVVEPDVQGELASV